MSLRRCHDLARGWPAHFKILVPFAPEYRIVLGDLGVLVRNPYYFFSDILRRKDEIYTSACDCTLWHIWLLGCFKLLRDGNASHFFYAAQRCRPIAIISGDNDSDKLSVPVPS